MAFHGTNACYSSGCRRQECKDAHAEYMRWYYSDRGEGVDTRIKNASYLEETLSQKERLLESQERGK